jgi:hypothetical protein
LWDRYKQGLHFKKIVLLAQQLSKDGSIPLETLFVLTKVQNSASCEDLGANSVCARATMDPAGWCAADNSCHFAETERDKLLKEK